MSHGVEGVFWQAQLGRKPSSGASQIHGAFPSTTSLDLLESIFRLLSFTELTRYSSVMSIELLGKLSQLSVTMPSPQLPWAERLCPILPSALHCPLS
jgi:hypothetical protein